MYSMVRVMILLYISVLILWLDRYTLGGGSRSASAGGKKSKFRGSIYDFIAQADPPPPSRRHSADYMVLVESWIGSICFLTLNGVLITTIRTPADDRRLFPP